MATEYFGGLSLAFAGHTQARNLISLCLGQLSVLHHCFTLVKSVRVPATALQPLPDYAKVLQLLSEFTMNKSFLIRFRLQGDGKYQNLLMN
jgi:hypothetical protein